MRIIIFLTILIFFNGCRANITAPIVTKNQAITKTQKQEITIEGKRFLVVGTYLNDIKHPSLPQDENEHFIISLYEGDENPYQSKLKETTLNQEVASWALLEKSDPLLDMLPLHNVWGYYYHIWSPKVYPDELNLSIKIDELRQVILRFQKDPK